MVDYGQPRRILTKGFRVHASLSAYQNTLKSKHHPRPPPPNINIGTSTHCAPNLALTLTLKKDYRCDRLIHATPDLALSNMSAPSYWLQRQRKSDLQNLADQVGLKE